MKVAISAGHGKYIRGASDILDEVDEARRVCTEVSSALKEHGVTVYGPYFDDVSDDQSENLHRITDWHNSQPEHDLDVSVHFNANEHTDKPMGTECLYVSEEELSARVSNAISEAGELIDRGPKYRDDLYVLNNTAAPAILIEVCFVDSSADVDLYGEHFDDICEAIAGAIAGEEQRPPVEVEVAEEITERVVYRGKCSWFGGPDDTGVSPSEGLAFFYEVDDAPHLFLDEQPEGTTGLARRLNPDRPYVACRWDYDVTPKEMLAQPYPAMIRSVATGDAVLAWPADWGPHEDTDRVADVSPGVMEKLGLGTDDEVEVIYPAPVIRR